MIARPDQCSCNSVEAFVNGCLTADELQAFESHLCVCFTCRRRLDDAIASEQDWHELRMSLATSGFDSTQVLNQADAESRSESVIPEAFLKLLSPCSTPGALGRIADYEVTGLLGNGGMGVVFRALDTALNRYVAIKIMAPHLATNGVARQRFFREAEAAAAVVHEHVIAIHSISQWQQVPFLVMPYVRGHSLRQRIDEKGCLPLRELLRIGLQVASGLASAHSQGLIHRDVKPANILLEEGVERVVLTDFGLARAVDDNRLTATDTLVGTPLYMSPEQARDETLDYRTDLFSLGSVLYEAATGRAAFQAVTSYGVLQKINSHQPTPPSQLNPDLPNWFSAIIARLMEKSAQQRFSSASLVEDILRQCLAHVEQPQLVPLPSDLSRVQRSSSPIFRRRLIMTSIALTALAAVVALILPETPNSAGTAPTTTQGSSAKYTTAEEAFGVGAAFYNSRNFKASREPFEAALKLSKGDQEMQLKIYDALLPAYRLIPEFEPFQTAAEFVITHHKHDAHRSLTRRSYLSFAYNRGQMENLVKRYEKQLKRNPDNYTAAFILSEIYANGAGLPPGVKNSERAIELIEHLTALENKRREESGKKPNDLTPQELQRVAQQKAKLAMQYVRAREYLKAAELYEQIAPLDPATQAWNLKEAASAHLKLGDSKNALRLALKAEETEPEARSEQLTHFFHRNLADILMAVDRPKNAIPHYELAIQTTTIEGYLKDTKASLQEAIEKSSK